MPPPALLPASHCAAASAEDAERHRSPDRGRILKRCGAGVAPLLGAAAAAPHRVQLPRGTGLAGGGHCAATGFHVTKDVLLHGFVLLHEENVNQNAEERQ